DDDIAEIEPGGYLFYDSTKPMPASKFREDINVIGAPLTEICNRTYSDMRQRQLFKNIIYLGVLSALLDMDVPAIEQLIGEQFRGKDTLIKPNLNALQLGRDWTREALDCPIGIRLERRDKVGERIFVSGNDAAALGAVYGGATVCAWYPITPSSSLAEAFAAHCQRLRRDPDSKDRRYAIIQAEDELASIGMVIGAAWNGARLRHERLAGAAARMGSGAPIRSRQGDEFRGPGGRQGIWPLPRRRRRRNPLSHAPRHASDARRLLHPRHHQGPLRPLQRGR